MKKPVLLWIDLRTARTSVSAEEHFRDHFEVRQVLKLPSYELLSDKAYPAALCFEYDFPDTGGLNLLKKVRLSYPRIPVIMLSEQHSESLAVWALRVRVWDYFVKPLTDVNYQDLFKSLSPTFKRRSDKVQCYLEPSPTLRLPSEVRRTVNASARQPFQPAISYIDGHLAEKLTEHELAVYCDMSSIKFSRGFRRAFGMTFQEYLLRLRINESQRLLRNPKASVVDVSYTVGFRDQSYFCRVFKRFVGMTPTLFRGANCGVSCREPCNLGEPLYLDNDLHRREDDSA